MGYGISPRAAAAAAIWSAVVVGTNAAAAEKVRITGLSDVAFGQVVTTADLSLSQSICVYSSSAGGAYSVIAEGSGSAGQFHITSGLDTITYQVRWAEAPGQANGSLLQAGTASQVFQSNASHQFCNSGPPSSASLIVTLPGTATANAQAGSYAGALSITIVPE